MDFICLLSGVHFSNIANMYNIIANATKSLKNVLHKYNVDGIIYNVVPREYLLLLASLVTYDFDKLPLTLNYKPTLVGLKIQ
jgi:hypothetical protein